MYPLDSPEAAGESSAESHSVQGMFELIEQSLAADRVVVEYDEQDGFPAYVLLDYQLISSEEGVIFEMWDFIRTASD